MQVTYGSGFCSKLFFSIGRKSYEEKKQKKTGEGVPRTTSTCIVSFLETKACPK